MNEFVFMQVAAEFGLNDAQAVRLLRDVVYLKTFGKLRKGFKKKNKALRRIGLGKRRAVLAAAYNGDFLSNHLLR